MLSLIFSSLTTGLVLFFWGWFFAVVLGGSTTRHFAGVARDEKEIRVWAIGLEKLGQGIILTVLYRQMLPFGEASWWNGLAFGALVGALLEFTYLLSTWVNFRVGFRGVLVNALHGWGRWALAGAVVGLWSGQ